MTTGADIRLKVAAGKFRGRPSEFLATYGAEVARRTTYRAHNVGMWDTVYTYTVHVDRTAAHQRQNKGDNSIRLVISTE